MTGTEGPRRAGRPKTPILNRALISDTALDILTTEGHSKLTMKHLSERLGVSVSALYNHIANKAELLLFVQDAVMSQVDTSGFAAIVESGGATDDQVAEALDQWSRSSRDVFARYSDLVPLIATMPVSGAPATRKVYEVVTAGLCAAGMPTRTVIPTIVGFESFIFGSAMDVNAPAEIFSSTEEELDAPVFQSAVRAFTDSVVGGGSGRNPYADEPFEWGLRSLIDAAVAQLD